MSLPPEEQRRVIEISVDGRRYSAREGDTLAAALLSAGIISFRRTPVSRQPRGPLCLMGVCFDCLVEVDGAQNVQSCTIEVRSNMQVRLPVGARRAEGAA